MMCFVLAKLVDTIDRIGLIGAIVICLNRKFHTDIVVNNANKRKWKNETNQSVKSERHNFVGIIGDNSGMCRGVLEVFADEVKAKLLAIFGKTICSDLDTKDITDVIDELLKEYEE